MTQSFLSVLPAFEVGCLAKTTSQECCKSRTVLLTAQRDLCLPRRPLVSGSKVVARDFAAVWSQLPAGLTLAAGAVQLWRRKAGGTQTPGSRGDTGQET